MGFPYRQLAVVLSLMGGVAGAQIVEQTPAPAKGNTANPTNIVYFATAGSDTNPCTFLLPCQTQAKLEAQAALGNITILLNGGDVFAYSGLGVHNRLATTASTTPTTNPIAGQNVTLSSYGTGQAIIEGADIITGFTLFDGPSSTYTYSYTPGTLYAEKIYVDALGVDSAAVGPLINMPNFPAVTYPAGTTYPGQAVIVSGRTWVISGLGPTTESPATCKTCSRAFAPPQTNTSLSGAANVQATPGSTYNDTQAGLLYVHLLDGSNPNAHTIQASRRPIGILCEGCNNWLVQNVKIEKYMQSGALFTNYSTATATNGYYTNIGNQLLNNSLWDNTGEAKYYYTGQSSSSLFSTQAGINMLSNSSASADNAALGVKVIGNTFGRGGSIAGNEDGGAGFMELMLQGFNSPEVANNTMVSYVHNGMSVRYNTNAWIHDNPLEGMNLGCVICWASNNGSLIERNKMGNAAGDINQGGGSATCTGTWDYTGHPELDVPGTNPCIVRYNLCHDAGVSTRGSLYNCWDNNTDQLVQNMLFDGNTCVNAYAACFSFEVIAGNPGKGVVDVTFRNNVISQNKNYAPYGDQAGLSGTTNNSNALYFANSTAPGLLGFFHSFNNYIQMGTQTVMANHASSTCTNFWTLPAVNDPTSKCVSNATNSLFTDITNGDYRLKLGSPAVNQPAVGLNAGALGTDYTQTFGARYPGVSITAGQAFKR